MQTTEIRPMFVKTASDPQDIADRAIRTLDRQAVAKQPMEVYLQAIGAGAVNQAVKAAVIALDAMAEAGYVVSWSPAFVTLQLNGEERTGIRFRLSCRKPTRGDIPARAELDRMLASAETTPGDLAGNLAHTVREAGVSPVAGSVQAIGAGAVNQAVKAAIICSNFLASSSISTTWRPVFHTEILEGEPKTAIQLHVTATRKGA